jgi:hypothetical protein
MLDTARIQAALVAARIEQAAMGEGNFEQDWN